MIFKILMITTFAIAILAIVEVLRALWTDDLCPKKMDKDIGDEAWRLLVKQSHEKSHTAKLAESEEFNGWMD